MESYKKIINVNNTSHQAYLAITQQIDKWWTDDFIGAAAQKGQQFSVAFGETKKTFEIEEVVADKRVVWHCIKAYIDLPDLKKKDEWVGTRVIWDLAQGVDSSSITVTHEGLHKNIECYSVCEPGWNHFIDSLKTFLATGVGTPYLRKPIYTKA